MLVVSDLVLPRLVGVGLRACPRHRTGAPGIPGFPAAGVAAFSSIGYAAAKAKPYNTLEAKFRQPGGGGVYLRPGARAGRAYDLVTPSADHLRANTLQAHRLIHWAQQRGEAEQLVERLFVARSSAVNTWAMSRC